MSHERSPGYIAGDNWLVCDVCGFDYRKSQMRKRWDGAMVCHKDYESRHPQDTLKSRSEKQNVVDARPVPEYRFLGTNEVQPEDL